MATIASLPIIDCNQLPIDDPDYKDSTILSVLSPPSTTRTISPTCENFSNKSDNKQDCHGKCSDHIRKPTIPDLSSEEEAIANGLLAPFATLSIVRRGWYSFGLQDQYELFLRYLHRLAETSREFKQHTNSSWVCPGNMFAMNLAVDYVLTTRSAVAHHLVALMAQLLFISPSLRLYRGKIVDHNKYLASWYRVKGYRFSDIVAHHITYGESLLCFGYKTVLCGCLLRDLTILEDEKRRKQEQWKVLRNWKDEYNIARGKSSSRSQYSSSSSSGEEEGYRVYRARTRNRETPVRKSHQPRSLSPYSPTTSPKNDKEASSSVEPALKKQKCNLYDLFESE